LLQVVAYVLLLCPAIVAIMMPRGLGIQMTMATPAGGEPVQTELVLLVETSANVENVDYMKQRQAYADVFRNPVFINTIERRGGAAILYVEWGDVGGQSIRIPWTRLDKKADCLAYALEIEALVRMSDGKAALAPAIEFAVEQIHTNSYVALRRLINVSGVSRCQNWVYHAGHSTTHGSVTGSPGGWGTPWNDVIAAARDEVNQINGICISKNAAVQDFYLKTLPQGRSAFGMRVEDIAGFPGAILQMLTREIASAPPIYD
jgi:hypothetical protein